MTCFSFLTPLFFILLTHFNKKVTSVVLTGQNLPVYSKEGNAIYFHKLNFILLLISNANRGQVSLSLKHEKNEY